MILSLSSPSLPFLALVSPYSLSPSLGADVTDYFNYGFTEETWKAYCEKQRKMRGEVASLNKIVVSSLPSRDLAWTTNKWYSRSSHLTTHTLAQVILAGWTCTPSIVVVVIRYNVECWLLCNEFEFVMIKDDIDTGILVFDLHLSIHSLVVCSVHNTPVVNVIILI